MQNAATWEPAEPTRQMVLTGGRAYLLAAICVGLAWLLRVAVDPLWANHLPYGFFFLAVIVVAQFTGIGPTVFTTVAGFLLGTWLFVEPRHSLLIGEPLYRLNGTLYFVVCGVVLYFSLRMRGALARERAAGVALGRLAAIVESSDDAIIGKDLDGRITSWNGGAVRLYGYTEAEALGQTIAFLATPETTDQMPPLLERVAKGEHIRHFETVRRRKDGQLVDVSLAISPVRNDAGKIIGISTIARDTTERKQAERERERLVSELQKALSEVKTLSGLFPICSYCKKIRDDKGYWNKIEQYLHKHSGADFTHSICPDCAKSHFGRFYNNESQSQKSGAPNPL